MLAVASWVLLLAAPGELRAADGPEAMVVPPQLIDVSGEQVDVESLASDQRLFFVTLKATWCPVCQEQLRRLRALLPRLRSCGATFVVLAPGPQRALKQVAEETGFPYPFVEDVELALARAAGLHLAADQIEPAIFEVNASREIVWMQRGRSGNSFSDDALLERLGCDELKTAGAEVWTCGSVPKESRQASEWVVLQEATSRCTERSIQASSRSMFSKPGRRRTVRSMRRAAARPSGPEKR